VEHGSLRERVPGNHDETMLPRLIGEDIELIFVPAQDQ